MSSFSLHTPLDGPTLMQFEGETMTAREIRIGRYMFVEGAIWRSPPGFTPVSVAQKEAGRRLPLPKVTRPRVVPDPDYPETRWCVRNGQIMHYDSDIRVMAYPSPERVKLWSDLLAYPTEDVDA